MVDAEATGEIAIVSSSTEEYLEKLHVPPPKILKAAENAVIPSYHVKIP